MILFNLVFRKQRLSVYCALTVQSHLRLSVKEPYWRERGRKLSFPSNINRGSECAADVRFSYCHLICMHAVVARMGVIIASWLSVLMGHSSAVELQMRRKGGLAGMAACPICLTCSSGGFSSIYRPLMSFTRNQHKVQPLLPEPGVENGLAHKRTRRTRLSQSPSESISNPQAFWLGTLDRR